MLQRSSHPSPRAVLSSLAQRHGRMTRWTLLALGLVLAALATVAAVSVRMAGQDRRRLVAQLGAERSRLLDETAAVIGLELSDIGEDLRFSGALVHATDREGDRARALG